MRLNCCIYIMIVCLIFSCVCIPDIYAQSFSFSIPDSLALDRPNSIVIDSEGNIYAITSVNIIVKFSPEGQELLRFVIEAPPEGVDVRAIAVDAMQRIYVVALDAEYMVQVFDSAGNFLFHIGAQGIGEGQFVSPTGIAIDAMQRIYITDEDPRNSPVQVFDSGGNFLFRFGAEGSGEGEFLNPHGIAVDAMQRIYVVDRRNHRIQVFDSSGNFLFQFGAEGSGEGQFVSPREIAVDAMQRVYVGDRQTPRVQVFDSAGDFLFQFGAVGSGEGQFDGGPGGIAVDAMQRIYVASSDRIQVFDAAGNFLLQYGTAGSGEGQFIWPRGIAVDAMKRIYVTDGDRRVQVFDAAGNFLSQFDTQGGEHIAVDAMQRIYVTDGDSRVQVFDSAGQLLFQFDTLTAIKGIAVDDEQRIYVALKNSSSLDVENRIQVFDSIGQPLFQFGAGQFGQFGDGGIAVDAMRQVYGIDRDNRRVLVFDATGQFLFQFGEDRIARPDGVAVDTMQRIYVADEGNIRIQVFDSNGNFLYQFGNAGYGRDQFIHLGDLAVDTMQRVYVVDGGNKRIQVFDSHVQVINFEDHSAGAIVRNVFADNGFGPIKVRGKLGDRCARNAAVVFDSSCLGGRCSGRDEDLGAPNATFGGPGQGSGGEAGSPWANETALGKLLIVHEVCKELSSRIVAHPDDTGGASFIKFKFPQPVRILSYTIIDHEFDERNRVKLYNRQGERLAKLYSPVTGNNGKAVVQTTEDGTGIGDVTRMVFDREGSGGLDNIVFLPEETKQSCESRYSPDLICEEGVRSCQFYVILDGGTCADYCASRGGRCLGAASDANNGCEVQESRPCDDFASDQICECSL